MRRGEENVGIIDVEWLTHQRHGRPVAGPANATAVPAWVQPSGNLRHRPDLLMVLAALVLAFLYGICTQYIRPMNSRVKQVDLPFPLLTGAAGIHTIYL